MSTSAPDKRDGRDRLLTFGWQLGRELGGILEKMVTDLTNRQGEILRQPQPRLVCGCPSFCLVVLLLGAVASYPQRKLREVCNFADPSRNKYMTDVHVCSFSCWLTALQNEL